MNQKKRRSSADEQTIGSKKARKCRGRNIGNPPPPKKNLGKEDRPSTGVLRHVQKKGGVPDGQN